MFKIIPILMGVIISYCAALLFHAFGMTNADGSAIFSFTNIASASWVGVPEFALCKFNISAVLVMAPIALATMMEHIGDISAISATVGKNFIEEPGPAPDTGRRRSGDRIIRPGRRPCKYHLR